MTSTKAASLAKTKMATNAEKVLSALAGGQTLSRSEIAKAAGIRLQSVCQPVKSLLKQGVLVVAGTKLDVETDREVETLAVAGLTARETVVLGLRKQGESA